MSSRDSRHLLQTTLALGSIALVLSSSAHATNGYFASGYDIQSQGSGGVGIALPQTAVASALNPAGIALVGNRLDLGVTYFQPNRNAQIVGNAGGSGVNGTYDGNGTKSFWIPDFGITKNINERITLGLAAYGNGGMNSSYNNGIPLFGSSNAGVNLAQLFVTPTVAWKFTPDQSLGLSVIYAHQTFSAQGLQNFTAPSGPQQFSIAPGNVTNNGTSSSNGVGAQLGWLGKLSDNWSAGLTYRSKISAGKFGQYSGLFADGGSFDIPATYGGGLTWKPNQKWTLSGDLSQIQYGQINSIANTFPQSQLLGQANGAGFGWKDVTVFKLGVLYKYTPNFTVRAGYNYNTQPIQSSQTMFNILAPGVIQHQASLGTTYSFSQNLELSAFYAHGFYKSISGSNSIPGSFGGGNANLNMYQDSVGVELGWKY